ncbi:MAG TPA: hypothetical protein VGS41_13945, partial [Chthonomonadales bacterium]|nr:hypothetical protein [Chthonomonadales bacterium]
MLCRNLLRRHWNRESDNAMKFTDGNWMMRQGVHARYAAEVYEANVERSALLLTATTRPIRHRGDTLEGPLLTVRLSSPCRDVVRVSIQRWKGTGARGPRYVSEEDRYAADVTVDADSAELVSGDLTVRTALHKDWKLEFRAAERVLTFSGARALGFAQVVEQGSFVHEQLALGVGECVYGLGERFTPLVKNGQVVDCWNMDGGAGSEQTYINAPFYLTNRGYGVFVNDPGRVEFEVASEKVSCVQFSVPGEQLEYFVVYGPTPGEILEKYTQLTGRAALPPRWSFGLWLTTSFTTSYDENTVTGTIS